MKLPSRIENLLKDKRGYPVPWFVRWENGEPDFRVVAPGKLEHAIQFRKCWICGDDLGANLAFVIGAMCVVNRITSEPPCHRQCAEFAVTVCPFLTKPRMERNGKDLPEGAHMPGHPNLRNPGVSVIWITPKEGSWFRVPNGVLCRLSKPKEVLFYREGRLAKRKEILDSIESGYPTLRKLAEEDGPEALAELTEQLKIAMELVPL